MRFDKMKRLLTALHRNREPLPGPPSAALEAELLARHRELYAKKQKGWSMFLNPKYTTGKIIYGCLTVLVLGIGACSVPSDVEMEIGQAMEMSLSAELASDDFMIQEALSFANDLPGVDNVSINEQISQDGKLVEILMWGKEMDGNAIEAQMMSRFPALADAEVVIKPLEGVIQSNLVERIGHAIFDFDVRGGTEEEFRQQIIQQLEEQGFTGQSVITIHEEDGQATIDIELTDDN
jgi:hypothetical protein